MPDDDTKTPSLGDEVLGFLTSMVLLYLIYTVSLATVVPYFHSFFLVKTDGTVRLVDVAVGQVSMISGDSYLVGNAYYRPKIGYTYRIGSEEIAGDHYSLSGRSYDTAEQAKSITSMYRVGDKVPVWYSVIDHHYAVLDPQVSYTKATAGGVFLIFCIAVIWRMISNIVPRASN